MTYEEYEDVYREALLCLRQQMDVGEPFIRSNGSRMCEVAGQFCTDVEVLERWWGKRITGIIQSEYPLLPGHGASMTLVGAVHPRLPKAE